MVSKDKIIVKTNKVMKEEAIPAWFDKEISKNSASSEEEDEMCKLLEEIE